MEIDTDDDPAHSSEMDTGSDTTSISSESSISNEIEQLINDIENIQCTHHQILIQLQHLSTLLSESNSITILSNGQKIDFYDVIDDIHEKSLEETGEMIFGKKLLEVIDSAEIYVSTS